MELKDKTMETLIEMDEPEALVATMRRTAEHKKGERWQALADELLKVEIALNARQQPDAHKLREHLDEWSTPGGRAKGNSQPQTHEELTHADATAAPAAPDAAPEASAAPKA